MRWEAAIRRAALAAWALLAVPPSGASAQPWRLGDALGLGDRAWVTLEHRARFEYLFNDFRGGQTGDDRIFAFRTLLHAGVRIHERVRVGAELMDSRYAAAADGTVLDTGIVNELVLLRAYVEAGLPWPGGGESVLRAGRLTLDVGDRRLVARNRFRNTINGFTGVDGSFESDDLGLRAFWVLPVRRLPSDPAEIREGGPELDEESLDVQFAGLQARRRLPWGDDAEVFVFGLHERDGEDRPTRNRRLLTPGVRIRRPPAAGSLDYEWESVLQLGRSRLSTASARDLDHRAHFHHLEAGYTFDTPWAPRLALQWDYASGDRDPVDGSNERFDTLFGARRFDFGPTGIYGPFVRANLNTPGIRLRVRPSPRITSFVAFRAFWLASNQDAAPAMGLQDPTGGAGSYVGSQIELRIRWRLVPGNVLLEGGFAHLFRGGFPDDAPRSNGQDDATYVYSQVVLGF